MRRAALRGDVRRRVARTHAGWVPLAAGSSVRQRVPACGDVRRRVARERPRACGSGFQRATRARLPADNLHRTRVHAFSAGNTVVLTNASLTVLQYIDSMYGAYRLAFSAGYASGRLYAVRAQRFFCGQAEYGAKGTHQIMPHRLFKKEGYHKTEYRDQCKHWHRQLTPPGDDHNGDEQRKRQKTQQVYLFRPGNLYPLKTGFLIKPGNRTEQSIHWTRPSAIHPADKRRGKNTYCKNRKPHLELSRNKQHNSRNQKTCTAARRTELAVIERFSTYRNLPRNSTLNAH